MSKFTDFFIRFAVVIATAYFVVSCWPSTPNHFDIGSSPYCDSDYKFEILDEDLFAKRRLYVDSGGQDWSTIRWSIVGDSEKVSVTNSIYISVFTWTLFAAEKPVAKKRFAGLWKRQLIEGLAPPQSLDDCGDATSEESIAQSKYLIGDVSEYANANNN